MPSEDDVPLINTPTLIMPAAGRGEHLTVQTCKLLAVSGPLVGQEFVMRKDSFTIGADLHNDLVLGDSTVSRRHSEIVLGEEGYAIRDLGSTNGTWVQGVRIKEAFLDEGTELQLGSTRLVFCPMPETMEYRLSEKHAFGGLLGRSTAMRRVFHLAERYAPTDSNVMIEGETGTGKEVLAEEIHKHSLRADKPFIVIDCASLSQDLVASELFGHTKGAFTGAITDRAGAFEAADGGTVFLDEIGDLAPELQPKLLRVLEKREIRRVGSNQVRKINVRIICATNKKLENEVNASNFREDLFFRLSVVQIEMPPLRKRKDDLGLLSEHFLLGLIPDTPIEEIGDMVEAARQFRHHDWPGNVRELRNLLELASYSEERPINLGSYLYFGRSSRREPRMDTSSARYSAERPFKEAKQELIHEFETQYLSELLKQFEGNVSRAARHAEIERAYLQRLVRKYGLK